MERLVFTCLCICCGFIVKAQYTYDFAVVDRQAVNIPAAQTYSTVSIASYVQANFKTDNEKLRAIYTWVISHIRYDADSMLPINWSLESDEKIAATLRRRKGVCENYASLFTDIALKSGFPSFVVSGYTKYSMSGNRAGHSWSAVCLQGQWFLCDPTWDIGSAGNTRFFLVSPREFIETHIPFDPLWQLLEYPVTDNEFQRGSFVSRNEKRYFNYADSAKVFLGLDSLAQLEQSTRRMRQAGTESDRQKIQVNYNRMKMAIIYGEKDMNLYNGAVADLNKANTVFNNYVQYRNNRFMPQQSDAQISSLLHPVNGFILSAQKKLGQIGQAIENFQYDTGTIMQRLASLTQRMDEQQTFLDRYLATSAAERERLFYK